MKKIYFYIIAIGFILKSATIVAQSQCSTPSPLIIGANDTVCNSQYFSALGLKFSSNTPAITTIVNTCSVPVTYYASWYSFTGDGTTIRVKIFGQNQASGFLVFENQTCAASMTALQCALFPLDNLSHTIDINTINGAFYKIAVFRQSASSSMSGNICAYKTNGLPYYSACDPVANAQAVNITVQANSSDCFTNFTNVVTSPNRPAITTGCDISSSYWWGKFTATGTMTKFYLWGKDQINAMFSVTNATCGSTMPNIFCAPSTKAKDAPNYYEVTTVVGQQYYVFIKNVMNVARLCVYSENNSVPNEPFCSASMSFEDNATTGWLGQYGGYHLVSAPGKIFEWDMDVTAMPSDKFEITSSGNDSIVGGMIPKVAPGGGAHSFKIGSGSLQFYNDTVSGKINAHAMASSMTYCFTVTPQNAGFGYKYAVVANFAAHTAVLQSLFEVFLVKQATGDTIQCSKLQNSPNDGYSAFQFVGSNTDVAGKNHGNAFTPWSDVMIDLSPYIGQVLCATFRVRNCEGSATPDVNGDYDSTLAGGTHFQYAYFDTYCTPSVIKGAEICDGDPSTILTAPAGYAAYLWAPDGQATQSITIPSPVAGTTYTVNLTSKTGCSTSSTVTLVCNLSTGIKEKADEEISIYPNPFSNTTIVHFKNAGEHNFNLIDQLGRVVKKEKSYGSEIEINRNGLSDGVYFYTIENKNKEIIERGKLILKE